jgi:hypothetical protein
MLSPADRIVEATLAHTLRPKGNDREKVIAAALQFVIEEFGYYNVIDVEDIRNLIDELKSTVTIEEPAQERPQDPPDAL